MIARIARAFLSEITLFSRIVLRTPLYSYQQEPARAIVESIINKRGLEFAIMFPRQSGKNETQAHIEAYLLNLFQRVPGAQIVKASPTYKPQSINARMRLERALNNPWNRGRWRGREGYMIQLGQAIVAFFSAEPTANVAGATASLLLVADEAQDIAEGQFDRRFTPMAASTNATITHWGTAWSSNTMLARAIRRLRSLEEADGHRRVFIVGPERVAQDNPAYATFVQRQVARLGRQHPLVRTQYYNETIDDSGGMFPASRRALMLGTHPPQTTPAPNKIYALLVDVAGADESAAGPDPDIARLTNPGRDATTATIVDVDLTTIANAELGAPTYRIVHRRTWIGTPHTTIYGQLLSLATSWNVRHLVIDATGVGAGLAAFLDRALPGRVIPFTFTGVSKSQLGWDFLAIIETGRYHDYTTPQGLEPQFEQQLSFCQYEVLPGPGRLARWSVPDGTRDPATNELVHDDLIASAALTAVLDGLTWSSGQPSTIIRAPDPLAPKTNAGGY